MAGEDFTAHGIEAHNTIQVLGVTLGASRRSLSLEELDRFSKVDKICSRIGSLPVSMCLKRALANGVATPKVVWGVLLNGRAPTKTEDSKFSKCFHAATKDPSCLGGRASVELNAALP